MRKPIEAKAKRNRAAQHGEARVTHEYRNIHTRKHTNAHTNTHTYTLSPKQSVRASCTETQQHSTCLSPAWLRLACGLALAIQRPRMRFVTSAHGLTGITLVRCSPRDHASHTLCTPTQESSPGPQASTHTHHSPL